MEHDELILAILCDPSDPVAGLALADWLLETWEGNDRRKLTDRLRLMVLRDAAGWSVGSGGRLFAHSTAGTRLEIATLTDVWPVCHLCGQGGARHVLQSCADGWVCAAPSRCGHGRTFQVTREMLLNDTIGLAAPGW